MTVYIDASEHREAAVPETFSDRHGYMGADAEITVREDAPEGLRYAIPLIAQDAGMTPTAMRRIVCQILLVPPDPSNWSDHPNVWGEVNEHLYHRALKETHLGDSQRARSLNQ